MTTETINGTYGGSQTPCEVFLYHERDGSTWYAVAGSQNVNLTWDRSDLVDGVDVETLNDVDSFVWPDGVDDEQELEFAVEE